jgi:polyribonucleotide nucleotidyltransferase
MGGKTLTIETGKLAKQADGSVYVSYGDTRVLVTACSAKEPRAGADFFPLTVEFSEKFYAAGKIPGSFHKREGRPTQEATLSARMIDRLTKKQTSTFARQSALRPLSTSRTSRSPARRQLAAWAASTANTS